MRKCNAALERVLRLTPQPFDRTHAASRSSVRLVKEYLRRVACWARLSGRLPKLETLDALRLDLAGVLVPATNVPPEVRSAVESLTIGGLGRLVAQHYVRWELVVEEPVVIASGLSGPYEPLVRLFEHGGELFGHHGFIHVNHCVCFLPQPLHAYADLPPLADLSDAALDNVDVVNAEPGAPADLPRN